jgi:hypothetical protein
MIAGLSTFALLSLLFQRPVTASPTDWVLSCEGKTTSEFIGDKRARQLVNTRVPRTLAHEVLEGLIGPPDPVFVTDLRYVSVSACIPHYCPMKAFFWIDTKTGIGLGAQFTRGIGAEPGTLRLGSNPGGLLSIVNGLQELSNGRSAVIPICRSWTSSYSTGSKRFDSAMTPLSHEIS